MIRVRGIKLLIEEDNEDNLLKKVFKKLRINNIDSFFIGVLYIKINFKFI